MSSARDVENKNLRLIDVRTVDRNIKKGLLTRKDYEKALKALVELFGPLDFLSAPESMAILSKYGFGTP